VNPASWKRFLTWLDGPELFRTSDDGAPRLSPWVLHVARIMPLGTLALAVAWFFGAVPLIGLAFPLTVQLGLAWIWGSTLTDYFGNASAPSPSLRRYHALFAAWEDYATEEETLRSLQEILGGNTGTAASSEIRSLERWLDAADSRASMLHVFFAAGLFWDVHVAWGMERWRARAGARVRPWFEALGELEALAALATLAFDHPDWCWPEFVEGEPHFSAEGLGHPLLSETDVKTSDVTLEPPGRFLLVTGSNMSGKSTLLRSVGLAAVLAQAGSVVCATRAQLTPLRAFTSMRIHDSLTGGVSLFMAELLRLKSLVDAVRPDSEAALLYLIDEVLQGTNSEERRVAARRIIGHLLEENAIGAVTTHDLALHDDPRLDPASSKVHFRETVGEQGDQVLTFDYLLRPGLATSRNALKLLRIVGLDDAGDGTSLA
jgi:energy-coupling factor transporter ATP-binding protein EcfA2